LCCYGLGAMLFSKDANDLVLKPIERMVKKVREVSENPLTRFEVGLCKLSVVAP
jgi:hypothetical protein